MARNLLVGGTRLLALVEAGFVERVRFPNSVHFLFFIYSEMDMTVRSAGWLHKAVAMMFVASGVTLTCTVSAQEVTLKAVNAFQEGTYFAKNFESFVKKVNDEGKGLVQINYLGGPKAVAVSDHGTAIRSGVVDLANTTASYTASLVPEGMSLSFSTVPMEMLRKNGGLDYLNKLYLDKGLFYLGRTAEGLQYHVFTNKKTDKVDFSGQKLRIASVYRDLFQSLGAAVVQTPAGEIYTALDRGVVDGFGWPLVGIFDFNWQEKVKYRIDPGFYSVEVGMVMNANSWKKLTPPQRSFIEKQVAILEANNLIQAAKDIDSEDKRQKIAGIQVLKFNGAQTKDFLKIANDAAWAGLSKSSPIHGPKLSQFMSTNAQ